MPARGRWFVTPHALARFREIVPVGDAAALSMLIRESEHSHLVRVLESGALLLRGPRPHRLRFVVRASPVPGALPQLVTVLPTFGSRERRCDGQNEA
jgi:hypothetical protein